MEDRLYDNICNRSFAESVKPMKDNIVLIYGAGGFGREMQKALGKRQVFISAFLDQRGNLLGEIGGVPVYSPMEAPFDKASVTVLFCIVMDKEERVGVIRQLKEMGYRTVIEGQALRCLSVQPDDLQNEDLRDYYLTRKERIDEAEQLFLEPHSLKIYQTNIRAHMTGDYADCINYESPMAEQYFPTDLNLKKGYARFIDCGAYIGDTAGSLLKMQGAIEAYAGFEPNEENYRNLIGELSLRKDRIGFRLAYPCAVAGGNKIQAFSTGTGSGMLSDEGNVYVQTVSLDQAIPDFHPTFLKMDIEGAEIAALCGAKELICKDRPDLAICVYHAVNHIWDIPLLLNSWNLGYRFYLRSYNAYTMETVLYASCDKES